MPLSQLHVEGSLDVILLTSVASSLPGGAPAILSSGSKGSLRPRVAEARKKQIHACYLRDRDFDTDPPDDLGEPTADRNAQGEVTGWRWCRHEIENYLLEPAIVAQATGWSEHEFVASLLRVAGSLQHYTAALWAVGTARRSLPPLYELRTRPEILTNEIKVPRDLTERASRDWVTKYIGEFRDQVALELADVTTTQTFDRWARHLGRADDPQEVLLCHAGKDLLAALEPELVRSSRRNPVEFRNVIRDWIVAHPALALTYLPEWSALLRCFA